MEFNRESLALLDIKGENGLRELARQRGVQLGRGLNKRDIIDALMRSLPNTAFTEGYNVNRAAPPPPPGMSQEQAKVEIKRRLDIMAREIYDKNSLLTTAQQRREQVAEYDKIRKATEAFERSEAQREIQEVADRLNAQRNIDIWGDDEEFGEMIEQFNEIESENNQFFFEGADQSKEGLAIQSLYEDEYMYNALVEEGRLEDTEYYMGDIEVGSFKGTIDTETIFFDDETKLRMKYNSGQLKRPAPLPTGRGTRRKKAPKPLVSGDAAETGQFASYLSDEGTTAYNRFRQMKLIDDEKNKSRRANRSTPY